MNFKRKKTRTKVKCNICTDARVGNSINKCSGRNPKVNLNKKLSNIKLKEQLRENE